MTQPLHLTVLMPDEASQGFSSITMPCLPTDTVRDVIRSAFNKHRIRHNRDLDPEGPGRWVFKFCGFADYLIHHDFKLGYYDHVVHCMRRKQRIEMELLRLSETDLMDLRIIMTQDMREWRMKLAERHRPTEDDWTDLVRSYVPRPSTSVRFEDLTFVPMSEIRWPFRVLVRGVEDCPTDIPCDKVWIEVNLFYNGDPLGENGPTDGTPLSRTRSTTTLMMAPLTMTTAEVPFSREPRFPSVWTSHPMLEIAQLPHATRVAFMLMGRATATGRAVPLSGVAIPLVDFQHQLVAGKKLLRLWPHHMLQKMRDPTLETPRVLNLSAGMVGQNPDTSGTNGGGTLHVVFDSYPLPVRAVVPTLREVMTNERLFRNLGSSNVGDSSLEDPVIPGPAEKQMLDSIQAKDPLHRLTPEETATLWRCRNYASTVGQLLPRFLSTVAWQSPTALREVYRLLHLWEDYPEELRVESLELLSVKHSDPVVREYAVRQLDKLPDAELAEFVLQLVQVLKCEPYHDSPLARMLLRRALKAPLRIGHQFFWMLRSEMHVPDVSERFGVLLYTYTRHCGPHRLSLRRQVFLNDRIRTIADHVKTLSKDKRKEYAQQELGALQPILPARFALCLTPRIECSGIVANKCKVMSSKKMPLWVVFENADPNGERYPVIFKAGDDLRQDQMTLQMLRVMDTIWLKHGLDLHMRPYLCTSTGDELGMIEVVKHSTTTAAIQSEFGGRLAGAFRDTPIDSFLRENNRLEQYSQAVANFVLTCAGYCVATYVMGIGDRHADNIMVTEDGHLFHIDFGHFLGNFKKKFGMQRERAPFVFTPEMAYVMGKQGSGERDTLGYADFRNLCKQAYNLLRARGSFFITLFLLMVPASMPELQEAGDITYLRDMLQLQLTEREAGNLFAQEIKNSLNSISRRIDNSFHLLKHY